MPLFIGLGRFTDQGASDIQSYPARARERLKNLPPGIKMHGYYATQGQYDLVAIFEAPSIDEAMKLSALVSAGGITRWETMGALSIDEFEKVLKDG